MKVVEFKNVSFVYSGEEQTKALNSINLSVEKGEFLSVLGHNGSGKSTLARLINGLLVPTEGKVEVFGMDVSDEKNTFAVRQKVGIVFQNPDNQMVASIVEDDIAFGPENIGVEREEIGRRIEWALDAVGMSEYRHSTPTRLSGGQKQRIAIAGVLAIKPDILILDEATAMLDPKGRKEVMDVVSKINKEEGMTVINITHFMEEALLSDRAIVLNRGETVMKGTPQSIFSQGDMLETFNLCLPSVSVITQSLNKLGMNLNTVFAPRDLAEEIACRLSERNVDFGNCPPHMAETTPNEINNETPNKTPDKETEVPINSGVEPMSVEPLNSSVKPTNIQPINNGAEHISVQPLNSGAEPTNIQPLNSGAEWDISCKNLTFTYSQKSPFAKKALNDVTLSIPEGEFFGIIGHTGSGKSTFVQHLNALIKLPTAEKRYKPKKPKKGVTPPTMPQLTVGKFNLADKKCDFNSLRINVGMVFQYPEYQLFAETVKADVAFGLKNFKKDITEEQAEIAVRDAIETVGLNYEEVANKSPFELSGGQRRRVAIAGVIVTKPNILVLDEPAAGLDPLGKKDIMNLLHRLHSTWCKTVIIVSHDMDEIAENCTSAAVFSDGKCVMCDTPQNIFARSEQLISLGLDVPYAVKISEFLKTFGYNIDFDCTLQGFIKAVSKMYGGESL